MNGREKRQKAQRGGIWRRGLSEAKPLWTAGSPAAALGDRQPCCWREASDGMRSPRFRGGRPAGWPWENGNRFPQCRDSRATPGSAVFKTARSKQPGLQKAFHAERPKNVERESMPPAAGWACGRLKNGAPRMSAQRLRRRGGDSGTAPQRMFWTAGHSRTPHAARRWTGGDTADHADDLSTSARILAIKQAYLFNEEQQRTPQSRSLWGLWLRREKWGAGWSETSWERWSLTGRRFFAHRATCCL